MYWAQKGHKKGLQSYNLELKFSSWIQVAATTDSTPNPVRLWRELGPDLEQGIERLRPDYRQCITLRFRQGKSYLEIDRIMHLPIGTVASNLLQALEQLREMLGPKLDSSRSDPPPGKSFLRHHLDPVLQ